MKNNKSHFRYNKRQRNGILYLGTLIVLLQLIYLFFDFTSNKITDLSTLETHRFQTKIDSLKTIEIENKKPILYPFNPSFITDYKGYKLGMTTQEIDKLLLFRKQGNYINSARQFQQVTGISDSLLNRLKPYFKFPNWVSKKNMTLAIKNQVESPKPITIKDINTATASDLKTINGIGEKLATRIIKFRNGIGGFYFKDQLNEVYGLKPEVILRLVKEFQILSKPTIQKIDINEATFKEILHLPYINYELTKKIFEYKDEFAAIQNLEELKKIEGFPLDKFNRITLYLKAE